MICLIVEIGDPQWREMPVKVLLEVVLQEKAILSFQVDLLFEPSRCLAEFMA